MFLRNLNPRKGLCNDTRLIVKEIGNYVLKVAVMDVKNPESEQIELIPRIKLTTKEDEYLFIMTRKLFPVKPSFAVTINKSQRQSLTNVAIDLRYSAFTHGQLYVALSRSTNIEGINILHREDSLTNTVKNIVYPELLI
jgi:ATP-dependent DNA helicase PIF1